MSFIEVDYVLKWLKYIVSEEVAGVCRRWVCERREFGSIHSTELIKVNLPAVRKLKTEVVDQLSFALGQSELIKGLSFVRA